MLVYFAFLSALFLLGIAVVKANYKFQTYFNPWFFFLCIEVLVLHLISIFCAKSLDLIDNESGFSYLVLCSSLYIAGYATSYWVRFTFVGTIVFKAIAIVPSISTNKITVISSIIIFFLGFYLLITIGNAGFLWFTDPRLAYLNYRGATGDGALFALAQWSLMVAVALCFNACDFKIKLMLFVLCVFSVAAYFYGSKQILLNIFIYAIFLLDCKGFKLKLYHFFIIGILSALVFVLLLGGGLEAAPLTFAGFYFSEYAVNTSRIFSVEVTSAFFPGEILLSNIWTYLPRFIYPDKPYEYGQVLINSILFPGAAQQGQTPGLLYWSSFYVDFGFIGVFCFGLLRGVFDSSLFSALRGNIHQALKLAFTFGLCITPLFLYAPMLYQYIFIFSISLVFSVFKAKRRPPIL